MREPFAFLVPLMGRSTSRNWSVTSQLCRNTILSMLAGGPEVRVILICNEVPERLPDDRRISAISLPPKRRETFGQRMHDKDLKILHGLVHTRQLAPCWLMLADADDLISNRLVPFVLSNGDARDGWFVEHGWARASGMQHVFKIRHFHRVCGTSFILRVSPEDLPQDASGRPQDISLSGVGHNALVDHFRGLGFDLGPVPFRAVIYNVSTGVNSVGNSGWKGGSIFKRLRRLIATRRITPRLREEFCLSS